MKKILCISILWCCAVFANAQPTLTELSYQVTGPSSTSLFCCSADTWCFSDINCRAGRFACGFSPSSLDFRYYFQTANPGGTFGVNPFRYKVDLLHNGITIGFLQSPNLSSTFNSHVFNVTPLLIGAYKAKVLFQKRTIVGWVDVGVFFTNTINVVSFCSPYIIVPPTCGTDVVISGTNFTTPLTQSQSWIASSGTTIVPANANVKLDADPSNGFVQFNPGFETQLGANLVAQALDGCGGATPMRQAPGNEGVVDKVVQEGEAKAAVEKLGLAIYPNPTKGEITVRHGKNVKVLQVYSAMGTLVKTVNTLQKTATPIDLSHQPAGIYILRADGIVMGRVVKQ